MRRDDCHSKAAAMKAVLLLLAFWGLAAVYAADARDKDIRETGNVSPMDHVGERSRSRSVTRIVAGSSLDSLSSSTATRKSRYSICP